MTRYWTQLEGVSLAGRHWLKQCLTSTPDDAWYLTRFDVERDAAVRVVPANAPLAQEQLAMWREAMEFDQPHIVRMLDAGRTEAEGADLIYAVCEYPDDFVAGVLADRPLSAAEAREVLNASLSALAFLHDRDLVHNAVDPSHIMAFGESIKLPSDTIRRAGGGVSAADDMWSLGATLHEVLTQHRPDAEGEADFAHLPEPFATIVRNTLKPNPGERWSVGDIERHLNPPAPRPVEPIRVIVEPSVGSLPVEGVARTALPVAKASEPPVEAAESRAPLPFPTSRSARETPLVERGFPMKWVPVAGLVAAVGLSVVIFRKPAVVAPPEVQTAPATQSVERAVRKPEVVAPPAVQPPPSSRPAERPARKPDAVAPAAVQSAPVTHSAERAAPPTRAASTPNPAAIWRVVVYTYNSRSAAEKKARSINETRASWRADVFTPRGDRPPFYVSLGGRMTLPQAERLQKEARAKGLPQDTFVRNFSN